MRKKMLAMILTVCMLGAMTACSRQSETTTEPEAATETETAVKPEDVETEEPEAAEEPVDMRIGSLKGPTSMGLVSLMDKTEKGKAANRYEFTMVTAADELLAKMTGGELDIAMVPANLASVLYNKTEGEISVININTLGVLYIVSDDDTITTIQDLKGKTLYLTGKGTSPDYVINYLLTANGLTAGDVTLEYKSEATEVASVLSEQKGAIGLLPQPFVTVACAQNENLKIVLDLTGEWNQVQGEDGSSLVTGVTIIRNDFLEENEAAVRVFLEEYKASTEFANTNVAEASELVAAAGIIEKAAIAEKAMPLCNITYLDGDEMKTALSGYLKVLYDQNPQSVGGTLPDDDFYE